MTEREFKTLFFNMWKEVDTKFQGKFQNDSQQLAQFEAKILQRFKEDPKGLSTDEIADFIQAYRKTKSSDQVSFAQAYMGLQDWYIRSHSKKRTAVLKRPKQTYTEKQVKQIFKMLIEKYDDNKNGAIDFGAEFDNLLYEMQSYFNQGVDDQVMSRSELRNKWYNPIDTNNDGVITFDEIFPVVMKQMRLEGLIKEVPQGRAQNLGNIDLQSDKNDFSESGSVAGDQALPAAPQLSTGRKMTEAAFKKVIQDLFVKHDENQKSGIEFGSEFDNFMREAMSVLGENSQMPKDAIRAYFGMMDTNKDKGLSFEEIYPNLLSQMQRKGLIAAAKQSKAKGDEKLNLSVVTDAANAFSEDGSVAGDQALPSQPPNLQQTINLSIVEKPQQALLGALKPGTKPRKFTEQQFKKIFYDLYKKHDSNQNSTIEFGSEWDNLVRDLLVNFAPSADAAKKVSTMPRNELRKHFDMMDKNKDGILRFQEIQPTFFAQLQKNGQISEGPSAKKANEKTEFKEEANEGGDQALPGKPGLPKKILTPVGQARDQRRQNKNEDLQRRQASPQKIDLNTSLATDNTTKFEGDQAAQDQVNVNKQRLDKMMDSKIGDKTLGNRMEPRQPKQQLEVPQNLDLMKSIESTGAENRRLMSSSMKAESKISSPPRNVMDNKLNNVPEIRPTACRRSRSPGNRASPKKELHLYNNRNHKETSPPRQPSPKRLTSKQRKEKDGLDWVNVRLNFNQSLARVYIPMTMETGMTDCHNMIREYSDSPQMVRIVIGALTDAGILANPSAGKNYTAMGFHAAMFGYLARIFGNKLIDTLDVPPSTYKTYERIFNFMVNCFFNQGEKGHEVIANGCAISIIEIIENVFDTKGSNFSMEKTFFNPLLRIMQGGVGASKAQVKSASFVLRKLVHYLIDNRPDQMTKELSDAIIETMKTGRVTESDYSEMVRYMIKFFNNDVAGVLDNKFKRILDCSIYAINCLTNNSFGSLEKGTTSFPPPVQKIGHIKGKQLDDLNSAMRLQKMIVDGLPSSVSKQIVTNHYQAATDALAPVLAGNQLGKQYAEAIALQSSWKTLLKLSGAENSLTRAPKPAVELTFTKAPSAFKSKKNEDLDFDFTEEQVKAGDQAGNPGRAAIEKESEQVIKENKPAYVSVRTSNKPGGMIPSALVKAQKIEPGAMSKAREAKKQEEREKDKQARQSLLDVKLNRSLSASRSKSGTRTSAFQNVKKTSEPKPFVGEPRMTNSKDDYRTSPERRAPIKTQFQGRGATAVAGGQEAGRFMEVGDSAIPSTKRPVTAKPRVETKSRSKSRDENAARRNNRVMSPIEAKSEAVSFNFNEDQEAAGDQALPPQIEQVPESIEEEVFEEEIEEGDQNAPTRFQQSPPRTANLQIRNTASPVKRQVQNQNEFTFENQNRIDTQKLHNTEQDNINRQQEQLRQAQIEQEREIQQLRRQKQDLELQKLQESRDQMKVEQQQLQQKMQEQRDSVARARQEQIAEQHRLQREQEERNEQMRVEQEREVTLRRVQNQQAQEAEQLRQQRLQLEQESAYFRPKAENTPQFNPHQDETDEAEVVPVALFNGVRRAPESDSQFQPRIESRSPPRSQAKPVSTSVRQDNQSPLKQSRSAWQEPQSPPQGEMPESYKNQQDIMNAMMKEQVVKMQQQLMDGFELISNKMGQMEQRIDQSDARLNDNNQEDQNKEMFRSLQQTILDQQKAMSEIVSKQDLDIDRVIQDTAKATADQLNENQLTQQINHLTEQAAARRPQEEANTERTMQEDSVRFDQPQNYTQQRHPKNPEANQKLENKPRKVARLTRVWSKATELAKKRDFESAYRTILTEGDDIYLLRLIAQTGPVVKFLDQETARAVISRQNKMVRTGVFAQLEVEWLDEAKREGHFGSFSMNEQNEYLDTLYQLGHSSHLSESVSQRASEVYQSVKQSVVSRQNTANRGMSASQSASMLPPVHQQRNNYF